MCDSRKLRNRSRTKMHSVNSSQSYLPLPEINDHYSFQQVSQRILTFPLCKRDAQFIFVFNVFQRSHNDSDRQSKRPPKLFQKFHDSSYTNRSLNTSAPHAISFKESSHSSSSPLLSSLYKEQKSESYFEQCFDVIAKIGEGSFGEVFQVRSKEDGRMYAVKKSIQLYRGEQYRQERIEEVRRYEQFSEHDNCITLYKAWEQGDLLYMQLELCHGSLETYLAQNSNLSEARIWEILVDLLLAVKALHDQNLVHLDIKLDNIMIGKDNVCKLGDFGLVINLNRVSCLTSSEQSNRDVNLNFLFSQIYTKPPKVTADTSHQNY